MKATALSLALQLSPLVLGAPVVLSQVQHSDKIHPIITSRVTSLPRWRTPPRIAPEVIVFRGSPGTPVFDNRPTRPLNQDEASRSLIIEKPVTTDYLLSLESSRTDTTQKSTQHFASEAATQHRLDRIAEDGLGASDADIAIAIPTAARLRIPCRYARLSRERNDMLAVSMALTFLLVVFIIEAWGSVRRR